MPTRSPSPSRSISTILNALCKQREKTAPSIEEFEFARQRVQKSYGEWPNANQGPIIYWMHRDQRVQDNWAFLFAQKLSLLSKLPLVACFCLQQTCQFATLRAYDFMLNGLKEVQKECKTLNIPFCVLKSTPAKPSSNVISGFIRKYNAAALVCDFSPLRDHKQWMNDIKDDLQEHSSNTTMFKIDAHNIIPVWHTSDHLEFAAYTIRRKIHSFLPEFLTEFPPLIKQTKSMMGDVEYDGELGDAEWDELYRFIKVDENVLPVSSFTPGYQAAVKSLFDFINSERETGLRGFDKMRNNPNHPEAISNMSMYLNHGQISAQRVILSIMKKEKSPGFKKGVEAFIEECVVRRELAENYCFYQANYDCINGAWAWAKETLRNHKKDKREYCYTVKQFEEGKTHDDLWNAAQIEMVKTGKMHGFMRMYWAKKILEWSKGPKEALNAAIELNDKYQIDGRDPNGYVGIMWSICGIHDHGFTERPITGKIRWMSYEGCARKFDIKQYMQKFCS